MSRRSDAETPASSELDLVVRVIQRIRAHGLECWADPAREDRWRADCRLCGGPRAVTIREFGRGGSVSLACSTGCDEREILAALSLHPDAYDVGSALDLADQAWTCAVRAVELAGNAIRERDDLRRALEGRAA